LRENRYAMERRVLLCTGGIGSGKTFVIRAFNALGVPSYNCDEAAKELYGRDRELLAEIVGLCGESVLDADGKLDRAAFAAQIFRDPELLEKVEALVHPAVIRDFRRWTDGLPGNPPVVIIESAILLERPMPERVFDYVLTVMAPEEVRMARALRRPGMDESEVRRRMATQWSDAERAEHADFIIDNDGRKPVLPAILDIFQRIKEDGKN